MGAKRKVDEKLYNKIKKELKTPKDDPKVIKKYSIGQTTVRAIRNSKDWGNYIERTSKKSRRTRLKLDDEPSSQELAQRAWNCVGIIIDLGILLVSVFIIRWILSLFGV